MLDHHQRPLAGQVADETAELGQTIRQHSLAAAPAEPGLYRTVTGAESISMGLVAGAQLAGLEMFFGGYPITPASAILHHLSRLKQFGWACTIIWLRTT